MFPTPAQFLVYVIFIAVLCEVYYWRASARAEHPFGVTAGLRWALGTDSGAFWIDKARIVTHGFAVLLLTWLAVSVDRVPMTSTMTTGNNCETSREVVVAYTYVWAPMFWRDASFVASHPQFEAELGTAVPCIVF